jgi:hypothetical protein
VEPSDAAKDWSNTAPKPLSDDGAEACHRRERRTSEHGKAHPLFVSESDEIGRKVGSVTVGRLHRESPTPV